MFKKTLLFCSFFMFAGLSAQAEQIPGGIVYSNGKDAVYYDFASGKETNLTADLQGAVVKDALAAAEDGSALVWVQNGKFHTRKLPAGADTVLKSKTPLYKKGSSGTVRFEEKDLDAADDSYVKNLTMSSDGNAFSFEAETQGVSWVLTPANPILNKVWIEQRARVLAADGASSDSSNISWPLYVAQADRFNGIHALTISNRYIADNCYLKCFGNVAEYKAVAPHRMLDPNGLTMTGNGKPVPHIGMGYGTTPVYGPALHSSIAQAVEKFSIKRSAHYGAWSRNVGKSSEEQLFAAINRTPNGWGSIELRDRTKSYAGTKKDARAGVYEIPANLKAFNGLSFKLDGSLSCHIQDKVFVIDSYQLKQGIEKSGIAKNTDFRFSDVEMIPANNIIRPTSTLAAEGIEGTHVCWVSEYGFIYIGKDGSLHHWENGKDLGPIPYSPKVKEFSYCKVSPQERGAAVAKVEPKARVEAKPLRKPVNAVRAAKPLVVKEEPQGIVRGKTLVQNRFFVADLKFFWEISDNKLLLNYSYKAGNGIPYFAFAEQDEIDDFGNLPKMDFRTADMESGLWQGKGGHPPVSSLVIEPGKATVVFKTMNGYTIVKKIGMDDNHVVYDHKHLPLKAAEVALSK